VELTLPGLFGGRIPPKREFLSGAISSSALRSRHSHSPGFIPESLKYNVQHSEKSRSVNQFHAIAPDPVREMGTTSPRYRGRFSPPLTEGPNKILPPFRIPRPFFLVQRL
jgi:hypothetical protein